MELSNGIALILYYLIIMNIFYAYIYILLIYLQAGTRQEPYWVINTELMYCPSLKIYRLVFGLKIELPSVRQANVLTPIPPV